MSTERTAWVAPVLLVLVATQLFTFFGLAVLLFVPLALVLIAVPPRRTAFIAFGLMLLILGLTRPATDTLWWVGRGWALILAAWFVFAVVVRPGTEFINRGLIAVLGTVGTAALLLLGNQAGWQQTDAAVAVKYQEQGTAFIEDLGLASKSWGSNAIESVRSAADVQARVFPALLALTSLCSLAVVWWLWRRVVMREPQPLRKLREFRFRDELAFPFLVAFTVLLLPLPLGDGVTRIATNVVVFMVPLYLLRGLGIIMVLSRFPLWVTRLLMVLLFPFLWTAALVVGVGDTWFDLRANSARRTQSN